MTARHSSHVERQRREFLKEAGINTLVLDHITSPEDLQRLQDIVQELLERKLTLWGMSYEGILHAYTKLVNAIRILEREHIFVQNLTYQQIMQKAEEIRTLQESGDDHPVLAR